MASNAQVYTLCRCWRPKASKPPVIGTATSDAQAAVGVCCIYWQGKADGGAVPAPGGRTMSAGHTTTRLLVVSKCDQRADKENGAPRSPPDAPASVSSCWSITAFPACVILPQMNRQPMCIWMVKPPFTQYISIRDRAEIRRKAFCPVLLWGFLLLQIFQNRQQRVQHSLIAIGIQMHTLHRIFSL